MAGKILVIRGGAIGDFILTLPAIAALKDTFPKAELSLLAYPNVAQLAVQSGYVTEVRSIEARTLAGFFARNGTLSEDLQKFFSSFDIIVSYLFDPDEIFRTNVGRCSKGQFIQGQHRPNENDSTHASGVFLKALERLAIFGADPIPQLKISAAKNRIGTIAIHPGSGSEKKNWPIENWEALVETILRETKLSILLIAGEAETPKLERLQRRVKTQRCELAWNLPLTEVATKLTTCCFFVGHDSGITHLAAAVGLPVLVLWGETNERIWRPQGSGVSMLNAGRALASLPVSEVWAALRMQLSGTRCSE